MLAELGNVLRRRGHLAQARSVLARALVLDPQLLSAQLLTSAVCRSQGDHAAAVQHALSAARAAPGSWPTQLHLAQCLIDAGLLAQAQRLLDHLEGIPAARDQALAEQALIDLRCGDASRAHRRLATRLARGPSEHESLLAAFGRACVAVKRGGDAVAPLRARLAREPRGSEVYPLLQHALGDCLDQAGHHDDAFAAWEAGNHARCPGYDPDAHTAHVDALIAAPVPGCERAEADAGASLLFIVGMPRSGTTLLEQMLARHAEVVPGGERILLPRSETTAAKRLGIDPSMLPHSLPDAVAAQMRVAYLKPLPALGDGRYYTDKLPGNYLRLALIARLFPAARVLHVVRDPLDTCLSCFAQNFGQGQPYSVRQHWLGRRYRDYDRVTTALLGRLPLRHFEVRYEALVSEPRATLEAVLGFLGLPLQAACLSPQASARVVDTASFAQVKAPIHTGSIGRALPYRAHLSPLLHALEGDAPAGTPRVA